MIFAHAIAIILPVAMVTVSVTVTTHHYGTNDTQCYDDDAA